MLTIHNKMLEGHIAQKAILLSTPLDRLPSKLEPNPYKHCHCVSLKEEVEDFIDPEDIPMGEGRNNHGWK